ncbi:DNA polymerase III subunit delta, partial [Candidatus Pelagibacter sp.]|nr:DNA polymerase III subunit delta [Candidatus Pelagibacter sp.]
VDDKVFTYEEKEILNNQNEYLENILNKSLFEPKKTIIIKRVTDKIFNIVKEINYKNLEDTTIILSADNLEKKSKIRTYFEKDKDLICVPFYPDNEQTLSKLAYEFLKEKKIPISASNINTIVKKCNGDRENLFNDLRKIENYCIKGKKINTLIISKLLSLYENYSVLELVDNCLAKNKNKTLNIINENNFSTEDCILITRTFLNKSKRILSLLNNYRDHKNIDLTISSAKPPIFWKDKEIIKQQIFKWSPDKIKLLIYQINELELLVKKNAINPINLITNFILEQSSVNASN